MVRESFFYRRFWEPLLNQLKQGTSPEKITWSVAIGITVSTFPILGVTTPLCALFGFVFQLNHVVLQAMNYLATPLQLASIPFFMRLGETVFDLPHLSFNPLTAGKEFMNAPMLFLKTFGATGLAASALWICVAPLPLILIRFTLLPLLKRKAIQTDR